MILKANDYIKIILKEFNRIKSYHFMNKSYENGYESGLNRAINLIEKTKK